MKKNKQIKFTICVPSFNRGSLAYKSVKHMLSNLPEDCSILVLDNASTNEVEYYNKIKKLSKKNEQLKYIRHSVNRMAEGNYLACFELAESKYMMWISDEDLISLSYIKYLLKQFKKNRELGILRGSIGTQKGVVKSQATIHKEVSLKAGKEAITHYCFTNNYMSGTVYNLKLIKKYNLLKYLQDNLALNKAYPHLYFELLIAVKCDVMQSSHIAIYEGKMKEIVHDNGVRENFNIYQYPFAFGSRLDQMIPLRNGLIEAVTLMKGTDADFINLYIKLVIKYFFLISLPNSYLYKANNMDMDYLKKATYNFCCAAIMAYPTLENYHDDIIKLINNVYDEYKDAIVPLN